jgi:hypothetical protein
MGFDILGITDIVTLAVIGIIIAVVIAVSFLVRGYLKRRSSVPEEQPEEIFSLVSKVKYPQEGTGRSRQHPAGPAGEEQGDRNLPAEVELLVDRKNLTESLQAVAEKYALTEITLATDDGLVLATSAHRDVQQDAVRYSQIARHQAPPDEPDVSLFELMHRESRLIGIIRSPRELPQNWKRQIRDDTKVILQWWL